MVSNRCESERYTKTWHMNKIKNMDTPDSEMVISEEEDGCRFDDRGKTSDLCG